MAVQIIWINYNSIKKSDGDRMPNHAEVTKNIWPVSSDWFLSIRPENFRLSDVSEGVWEETSGMKWVHAEYFAWQNV